MDRDLVLLGIKYEAAKLGGLDGSALAKIEEGIAAEAGDAWISDPSITHGRNAARAEHGLPPIGGEPVQSREPTKRSLWQRLRRG